MTSDPWIDSQDDNETITIPIKHYRELLLDAGRPEPKENDDEDEANKKTETAKECAEVTDRLHSA